MSCGVLCSGTFPITPIEPGFHQLDHKIADSFLCETQGVAQAIIMLTGRSGLSPYESDGVSALMSVSVANKEAEAVTTAVRARFGSRPGF